MKNSLETGTDFYKPTDVGEKIENVYKNSKGSLTYFESCTEVAEQMGIEIESLAKMLPKVIKEKLLKEASDLRLLKPQYRITQLP